MPRPAPRISRSRRGPSRPRPRCCSASRRDRAHGGSVGGSHAVDPGKWQYEPKWDGFRVLARRDGDSVDLRGKSGKPLGRFFPEVLAMLKDLRAERFVLDGELVIEVDGVSHSTRFKCVFTRRKAASENWPSRSLPG